MKGRGEPGIGLRAKTWSGMRIIKRWLAGASVPLALRVASRY